MKIFTRIHSEQTITAIRARIFQRGKINSTMQSGMRKADKFSWLTASAEASSGWRANEGKLAVAMEPTRDLLFRK